MPPKIELLKTRDFGEIITDTFVFIKENFKPLIICFLIFCGFFLVAAALTGAIQQIKMLGVVNNNNIYSQPSTSVFSFYNRFRIFSVEYFLTIFFSLLGYIAMPVTVMSYMSLYKEKGNVPPTPQEVWGYFKYFYLKILGSGILIGLLLIVGLALCIIPGIYLYPIFALIFPIMIFENTSFGYAFNKSFRLIKDNWWLTFGTLVVIIIMVYFATIIVVLPTTLFSFGSLILHPGKGLHVSVVATVITTFIQHLAMVFSIVPLVAVSLCYFNLSEKTESTGLMERINKLGNNTPDDNLPVEEF